MGDTGSLTLGYVLSFLAIKYSQYNPDVTPYTEGAFVIAFSIADCPCVRCDPCGDGSCSQWQEPFRTGQEPYSS